MTPGVNKTDQAKRDLLAIAHYLEQTASLATAMRFLNAAQSAFESLARLPGLGSVWESPKSRLRNVRVWPIRRFRKYLIFYRPKRNGVEILRVIHGSRNIDAALESGNGEN